jgi:hypothetical protein
MTLDEKIGLLERAVRRQRRAMFLTIVVAIALFTLAVAPATRTDPGSKELILRKLSIQDSKGRDRIILSEGAIVLKDEQGKDRLAIFTNQNNVSEIEFFDAQGRPRIATVTDSDDGAVCAFYDPKGPNRIVTGVGPDGGAFTRFDDTKGRRRFDLGTSGEDQVLATFYDKKDNALINIGVLNDRAFDKIFDATGKVLHTQP